MKLIAGLLAALFLWLPGSSAVGGSKLLMGAGKPPTVAVSGPSYVGSAFPTVFTSGSTTVSAMPAGTQAGDTLILVMNIANNTFQSVTLGTCGGTTRTLTALSGTAAGLVITGTSNYLVAYVTTLAAGEASASVCGTSVGTGGGLTHVVSTYRGVTSVTYKANPNATAAADLTSSFTADANMIGVVIGAIDTSVTAATVTASSASATWTTRGTGAAGCCRGFLHDSFNYTSTSTITQTGFTTAGNQGALVLELRGP